jgi:hypothetical protein
MRRSIFSICPLAVLAVAGFALASDPITDRGRGLYSDPGVGVPTPATHRNSGGYLKIEKKTPAGKIEREVVRYTGREGDLVFYDDRNPAWTALFAYAGTGPPLHMGIVLKKADGSLAVLEAGPDDTTRVSLLHLEKRLHQFHQHYSKGTITIRCCKKELTAEQSMALSKFAQAQDGKRYAVGRLLLQGTSLRTRGPVRELVLGKTVLDRDSWICSELSVAAGTVAKLFDPKVVHSNVAYPRDLVDNVRYDLSQSWHDVALWLPNPPSEKKKPRE